MISYKIIFVGLILAAITFEGASNASAIDTELSHGWQFSMNLSHVSVEKNTSIDQNGTKINVFIVKNDYNQTEKAVITPTSFARLETFNNLSMSNYIDEEMKSRNLSKLSVRPYEMAGTEGAFGRAIDNKTGSYVYLAYFPAWPSDSTSNRAVLIVSTLGEGSYRLFDTIQILKCPDRKEPLSQFLKSSEKIPQGLVKLESERRTTAQLSGNTTQSLA
jgi:hypothetical protein